MIRLVQREPASPQAHLQTRLLSTLKVSGCTLWCSGGLQWPSGLHQKSFLSLFQDRTCPMAVPWTPTTTSPPSAPASLSLLSLREAALESFTSPWTCSGSSCTWSAVEETLLMQSKIKYEILKGPNLSISCLSNRWNSLCQSRF